MALSTLERLRAHAISQSLFPPTTLKSAVHRLAFVQADPIRAPARAQDLILRHRVKGYRAGDLERRYPALDLEEDVLYAYGFLPRTIWRLIHPRKTTGLSKLEKQVLDTVCRCGATHPRELEAEFGSKRKLNAWGGYSKATTRALEELRHRGLLRIARRENGIRVYEAAPPSDEPVPSDERLRKLVMVIARIMAPAPVKSLQSMIARWRRLGDTRAVVSDLVRRGKLQKETIDGVSYIWPTCKIVPDDGPRSVRFLAPFDPLVWDRRRFEHFWRWPYRFEAYTPRARRQRGYYALPLLWGDGVIGWANARVWGERLDVELGFVEKRPRDVRFRSELELEIGRMEIFLGLERSGEMQRLRSKSTFIPAKERLD